MLDLTFFIFVKKTAVPYGCDTSLCIAHNQILLSIANTYSCAILYPKAPVKN